MCSKEKKCTLSIWATLLPSQELIKFITKMPQSQLWEINKKKRDKKKQKNHSCDGVSNNNKMGAGRGGLLGVLLRRILVSCGKILDFQTSLRAIECFKYQLKILPLWCTVRKRGELKKFKTITGEKLTKKSDI